MRRVPWLGIRPRRRHRPRRRSPVLGEEELRRRERDRLAGAHELGLHAAAELAGADPHEGDAVPVGSSMFAWILNTKPVIFGSVGDTAAGIGILAPRRRRDLGEPVDQVAHAEIAQSRAEEDRVRWPSRKASRSNGLQPPSASSASSRQVARRRPPAAGCRRADRRSLRPARAGIVRGRRAGAPRGAGGRRCRQSSGRARSASDGGDVEGRASSRSRREGRRGRGIPGRAC